MIPSAQTWAIIEAICDAFSLVVTTCVINQWHGIGYYQMFLLL
jgi:hypothetical protein